MKTLRLLDGQHPADKPKILNGGKWVKMSPKERIVTEAEFKKVQKDFEDSLKEIGKK